MAEERTELAPARRAGRPRDARADAAIREATLDLIVEGGYGAVTFEAVAARSGVARTTIYRRWASRVQLVMEVVRDSTGPPVPRDTGSLRGDLLALETDNAELIESPGFRSLASRPVADLTSDPALARSFVAEIIEPRRALMYAALDRAVARQELPPGLDAALIIDQLTGPLWYRVMVRREKVTRAVIERVVDTVLAGYAPRSNARRTATSTR